MDVKLLGLPLEEAEELLRRDGIQPEVHITRAPRDERTGGILRVVRVQGHVLTAAAFHEQLKTES